MLRSEVPQINFMDQLDEDVLQDMDYDVMKQVIQREGKREVWTIVNTYNKTAFREQIHIYQE